ncbi:MAG: hypothetical protein SPM02_00800 [Bacteroidales bacterium]|nr:hypothetical protein [Bacteroidales bacterium]
MIQEVKYNGVSTNPSDYECNDGDLALCSALINEDGRLQPLPQPSLVLSFPDGLKVVAVHRTSAFKHYILSDSSGTTLLWLDDTDTQATPTPIVTLTGMGAAIQSVTPMGNTLVVLSDDGIHYILWHTDADTYTYKYLGSHFPEIELSFGLQGHAATSQPANFDMPGVHHLPLPGHIINFDASERTHATDPVLAAVNSFIADRAKAGKFIFPFFVRYAYRLFDGSRSLTMHSSPVLMITASDIAPYAFITEASVEEESTGPTRFSITVGALTFDLDYICTKGKAALAEWSDIVKSVDIFISAPIYTYDQSGEVLGLSTVATDNIASMGFSFSKMNGSYGKHHNFSFFNNPAVTAQSIFLLPRFSQDKVAETVEGTSSFYLLSSIEVNNLADSQRTTVNVPQDYMQSLLSRERMTDDYDSHDDIFASRAFVYNNRLNLANVDKLLARPPSLSALVPYIDTNINPATFTMYLFINQNGQKVVVKNAPDIMNKDTPLVFLYYPNPNAYKAVIIKERGTSSQVLEIDMQRHDFLAGTFSFEGWDANRWTNAIMFDDYDEPVETDRRVPLHNKIYTSGVGNPFFFPVTGINSVGTGSVLGIAAATKALSEGQFGEFPLYAFTSEGIWALSVNSSGGYSNVKPVSRDVCINPDSITPIDNAVLFASSRGIMLLQSSSTVCISDPIKSNPNPSVPYIKSIPSIIPFPDFLTNCRMAYDYTHQRVILFNHTCDYAYIYSLKSHLWGMAPSNLISVVNDYPDTLAMTSDGTLVSLTQPRSLDAKGDPVPVPAFYITRPIKLSPPNALKTVSTIIQRGLFQRGDVQTLLYGSRDLFNWHLIASSKSHELHNLHGSPYKYFRIATFATLTHDKSLDGVSIEFKPRHTNTLL